MSRLYEQVSILAGGYSAGRYKVAELPGFVIGVNDAAVYGRVDAVVSMDRLWLQARWDHLLRLRKPVWTRPAALSNIPRPLPPWVTVFDCDYKSSVMSDDPKVLNGTNSGLCAVNLAYQLRPVRLRLYGLDGSFGPAGQRHWYRDYEFPAKTGGPQKGTSRGTLQRWQRDLGHAVKQCRAVGINVEMMR